jgi:hypothetical protein
MISLLEAVVMVTERTTLRRNRSGSIGAVDAAAGDVPGITG